MKLEERKIRSEEEKKLRDKPRRHEEHEGTNKQFAVGKEEEKKRGNGEGGIRACRLSPYFTSPF
ncbi:MAG: hypothetical protein GTO45_26800 [Candidatus Aminicenantes bacterium]|nr:hypothetical protein [Candidatus Aminicenantes bacterium]NIM82355.1 hypothetical protein [Candidatus Aminicenantes bacterium]NIN21738.1 hypothetical protein [Candidatus Aminicenantes bacterium]NIN45547.1 hypothetical protein [Candidatus Aminicenantes bacterium]NIN88378.1 hypothetical protein [Candidatus Aminicenantes bacterium]